jgi:hypothetical protein
VLSLCYLGCTQGAVHLRLRQEEVPSSRTSQRTLFTVLNVVRKLPGVTASDYLLVSVPEGDVLQAEGLLASLAGVNKLTAVNRAP